MPDVSIFNLGGQSIGVKDATSRSLAQQASTAASQANTKASEALQLVQKIEELSRVTVSYEQENETITIATSTHEGT